MPSSCPQLPSTGASPSTVVVVAAIVVVIGLAALASTRLTRRDRGVMLLVVAAAGALALGIKTPVADAASSGCPPPTTTTTSTTVPAGTSTTSTTIPDTTIPDTTAPSTAPSTAPETTQPPTECADLAPSVELPESVDRVGTEMLVTITNLGVGSTTAPIVVDVSMSPATNFVWSFDPGNGGNSADWTAAYDAGTNSYSFVSNPGVVLAPGAWSSIGISIAPDPSNSADPATITATVADDGACQNSNPTSSGTANVSEDPTTTTDPGSGILCGINEVYDPAGDPADPDWPCACAAGYARFDGNCVLEVLIPDGLPAD